MRSGITWLLHVATLEARKRFQYRFDFWFTTIGSAFGQIVLAYAVWVAVFEESNKSEIGGYTLPDMMGYYLLAILISTTLTPAFGLLSEQIYRGELSKYLLYPVSTFAYFAAQYTGKVVVTALQGLCAVLLFLALFGLGFVKDLTLGQVVMTLLAFLLAGTLIFTISFIIELFAFWVDEIWALMVTFQFISSVLGGTLLPLSVFPEWIVSILLWLPFSCMVWLPTQTFRGEISLAEWSSQIGLGCSWLILLLAISAVLWSRGRLRYTGVGI